MLEDLFRHAHREIDEAVILVDFDTVDVTPLQTRFIRDRTDDVAGLHAMHMAHFDTKRFQSWAAFGPARGRLGIENRPAIVRRYLEGRRRLALTRRVLLLTRCLRPG